MNSKDQQVYTALDFNHSDGYFKSPQDYRRFNGLLKYNAKVSEHHYVTGSISGSAVQSGLIWNYLGYSLGVSLFFDSFVSCLVLAIYENI